MRRRQRQKNRPAAADWSSPPKLRGQFELPLKAPANPTSLRSLQHPLHIRITSVQSVTMADLTGSVSRRDEDGECLYPSISSNNEADIYVIEVCPICKSSRYLNPDMRFLINPECYHRICDSCVDRLFSAGPNSCPVVGCKKTLRKNRFRTQTFEDIGVEREVDIRKRVMAM
jgi:hypothetical protein